LVCCIRPGRYSSIFASFKPRIVMRGMPFNHLCVRSLRIFI
jgi:hypothetical protein